MRKNSTRSVLFAVVLLMNTSVFGADYYVTNSSNAGAGSLRQAVLDANANPGADNILFAGITAPINLLSTLTVTDPVNINGYSHPAAQKNTITLRTISVTITATGLDAFTVSSGGVSISGLAIFDASRAIVLTAAAGKDNSPVKIWGNSVGVDQTGQVFRFTSLGPPPQIALAPITFNGIHLLPENPSLYSYANPRVFIGTDGDGSDDANEGNWITQCGFTGIALQRASRIVMAGNFIGTNNVGATWPFSNNTGIEIDGQNTTPFAVGNRIGTDGNGTSDVLERNVVSANFSHGISIKGQASANIVSGNIIGLSNGGAAAGNGASGIFIGDASSNVIGITPTGGSTIQANYISSNVDNGITIHSGTHPANGNNIMGNFIGLNTLNEVHGNLGSGIFMQTTSASGSVSSNIVGSDDNGTNDNAEANVIAANGRDGVGLMRGGDVGVVNNNRISRNSFFGNGNSGAGLGINLLAGGNTGDGITSNDVGDGDAGPNDLYNFPENITFGIDGAAVPNPRLSTTGTAPPNSVIQFYVASADAAPSNPNVKEGRLFLFNGQDNGPDDLNPALGVFSFNRSLASLANPIAIGQEVNAISISTLAGVGNTSEFSEIALVLLPVQFVSFDAQLQGEKVLVTWATAQEQNASHFEVQKSVDGTSFATIGSVNAKGNSTTLTNYAFTDNNVAPGVSYYRLRQVDLDAKFVYTKTVTIKNEGRGKAFYAWPNPVTDVLNVSLNQTKPERLMLRVVDYNGRTLRSNAFNTVRGLNQVSLNFSGLPAGMYIIQITGGETTLTQKIIKN